MLLTEFRCAFRNVEYQYELQLRRLGVTARQFELLRTLGDAPQINMRQGDLSRAVGMDRSSASGSLALLEKSRFIERAPACEDQRIQMVRLKSPATRILLLGQEMEKRAEANLTARLNEFGVRSVDFRAALRRIADPMPF